MDPEPRYILALYGGLHWDNGKESGNYYIMLRRVILGLHLFNGNFSPEQNRPQQAGWEFVEVGV